MMKKDYTTVSIVFAVATFLISVFFDEYMFGLDLPLMILGLSFLIYVHFRQRRIKKQKLRKENGTKG